MTKNKTNDLILLELPVIELPKVEMLHFEMLDVESLLEYELEYQLGN